MVFSDLSAPRAEQVYSGGVLVAENGRLLPHITLPAPPKVPSAMRVDDTTVDFSIPAAGNRIRVIDMVADQVVTGSSVAQARIELGLTLADPGRDLLKIAVVERYSGRSHTGRGFVRGFGLKQGALASSVAHDSHNIIVVGVDDRSMHSALKAVVEMGGGLAAVRGHEILGRVPLPIGGLMSPDPLIRVREQLEGLIDAAHRLGATLADPFMAIGFAALPVIPALKITDKGLVDVTRFEIVPLFV